MSRNWKTDECAMNDDPPLTFLSIRNGFYVRRGNQDSSIIKREREMKTICVKVMCDIEI